MKRRPRLLNKTLLKLRRSIQKDFSSKITRPQTPSKVAVDGKVHKKRSSLENYSAQSGLSYLDFVAKVESICPLHLHILSNLFYVSRYVHNRTSVPLSLHYPPSGLQFQTSTQYNIHQHQESVSTSSGVVSLIYR
jgi:hypothetical protein